MHQDHKNYPPSWSTRFLHWYCPEVLLEEIEGDLLEEFYRRAEAREIGKANRRYAFEVTRFCNPATFKKQKREVILTNLIGM